MSNTRPRFSNPANSAIDTFSSQIWSKTRPRATTTQPQQRPTARCSATNTPHQLHLTTLARRLNSY